jgi:hypothetical protein
MVTQHNPTLGRPPRAHGAPLGAVVTGLGLAALLAVALLVWQSGRADEQPAPLEPETPAIVVQAVGGSSGAARSLTVYVVATAEEAGQVAALFEALDPERRYGDVSTVVVASDDEGRGFQAAISALNGAREQQGLMPIQLVTWPPRTGATAERAACADDGAGDPALVRFTCR